MYESELSQGVHQSLRVPRLSAVMPVSHEEDVLDQALSEAASTLDHVADGWEPVVVDDGSTDRAPEILADWSDREPWLRRNLES